METVARVSRVQSRRAHQIIRPDPWTPLSSTQLAKDRGGCRCIETLLAGTAGQKAKDRVLQALKGSYGDLARGSAAGGRMVELCFEAARLEEKEAIAGELAARENALVRRM